MRKSSRTPEQTLQRILWFAKFHGTSVTVVAGIFLLFSIGDLLDMAVCAAILVGGLMELSGRKQLHNGQASGVRRLVRAQLVVFFTIELYCAIKLIFDRSFGVSREMRGALTEAGVDMTALEPMVRQLFYAGYVAVALISIIYLGGLALYYGRRAGVVQEAIAARLRPPAPPVRAGDPEDWVT